MDITEENRTEQANDAVRERENTNSYEMSKMRHVRIRYSGELCCSIPRRLTRLLPTGLSIEHRALSIHCELYTFYSRGKSMYSYEQCTPVQRLIHTSDAHNRNQKSSEPQPQPQASQASQASRLTMQTASRLSLSLDQRVPTREQLEVNAREIRTLPSSFNECASSPAGRRARRRFGLQALISSQVIKRAAGALWRRCTSADEAHAGNSSLVASLIASDLVELYEIAPG